MRRSLAVVALFALLAPGLALAGSIVTPGGSNASSGPPVYFHWDGESSTTPSMGSWTQRITSGQGAPVGTMVGTAASIDSTSGNALKLTCTQGSPSWANYFGYLTSNSFPTPDYTARAIFRPTSAAAGQWPVVCVRAAWSPGTGTSGGDVITGYCARVTGSGGSGMAVNFSRSNADGTGTSLPNVSGSLDLLVALTSFSAANDSVILELTARGAYLTLRINGRIIYRTRDATYTTGGVFVGQSASGTSGGGTIYVEQLQVVGGGTPFANSQ